MTLVAIDLNDSLDRHRLERLVAAAPDCHLIVVSASTRLTGFQSSSVDLVRMRTDPLGTVCNRALKRAISPYVAFVPVDSTPSGEWLEPAVSMLDSSDGLSAVCGRNIGTPSPAVSVLGLPGRDLPEGDSSPDLLATSLDGTVMKVRHARAVGGFAALSDWWGLGMNLGWRLWLAGGSVRSGPGPDIEGAHHATPDPDTLLEAAVASVQTCWEDRRSRSALAALEASHGPRVVELRGQWQGERARIQKSRRRSDAELLRLFQSPEADSPLSADFGKSRRLVVVTDDVLSQAMAGPSIRAWHLADELAKDHEVRLATTTGIRERSSDRFSVEAPSGSDWEELETWSEVIIHQGYALTKVPALRASDKIMVVDAYDPIQLEVLELSKGTPEPLRGDAIDNSISVLNDQLRRADYVVCASEKQRDLWLGQLSSLGRLTARNYDCDPTLRRLIDVVPFGLPSEPPVQTRSAIRGAVAGIDRDDPVVIWGGGLYNWFDPITLINAINLLREEIPSIRLFFLGGQHPNPLTPEMRTAWDARQLSDELGLTSKNVFFNEGWVEYEQRQNYLLDADVGVSLHLDHIETAFSFRTRILDYLWSGLPIVATAGDAFAEVIEQKRVGIVVPPGDVPATASALQAILTDADLAASCRRQGEDLRTEFTWPLVVRPLVDFCAAPEHAADRIGPPGMPAPRDGLPSRRERVARLGRSAVRRYRRGGIASVTEGALNTARRITRDAARH